MTERLWYIKNCSLFDRLSAEQLSELERHARMRTFPKRSAVYLPGEVADSVFLLAQGRVRLCSATPEGKQALLALIEPGELFGELALVDPSWREERAEAVLDSTVILLPGDDLQRLMEQSPSMSLGVTKLIGLRRQRIERRLKSLLFRSNRDRLIHLLIELAEQYGRPDPEGVCLGVKLSHQDLANIIGSTRETVTLVLGELQLEGLVRVGRQKIVIRQLEAMVRSISDGATGPSPSSDGRPHTKSPEKSAYRQ